ncbi:MAG TPA: beta-phosphoglucomutase [Ruminiclostridium sp.]|jgi:beta-phosphoglucomutase|nr:beta-phosphoglucomutase [Ruminiclostridium sp.]
MSRNIKLVVFDLDGVITDTAVYHYKAWKKLADEIGVFFDSKINEQLKGIDRMASLEIILKKSEKSYSADEKNDLAARKNEYYKEFVEKMTPEDILPGVENALSQLKSHNIKTALASASKNAFTVIDKLKLRSYFDYIVDAKEIKKGKPDPEIFMTAAQRLDIPCTNSIGVEDAKAGIAAIKAAGMYAVGIGDRVMLSQADDVISGMDKFNIEKYLSL